MSKINISPSYKQAFLEKDLETFDQIMAITSNQVFKENKHRSVVKFSLWHEDQEKDFFCKRHFKPENKDKWKDLLALRWAPSDGRQELENIRLVADLGIPTMQIVAWGEEKGFSFSRKSFLITESLGDLERLEDYFIRKYAKPLTLKEIKEKRALIQRVAEIARLFHGANCYHRDFYCGHFLVKEQKEALPILYLIDLQRVRQRCYLRRRWKTKDLAALNFTADSTAISKADRLRFFLAYLNVLQLAPSHKRWIHQILSRTQKMDRHTSKKRQKYLDKKD